MQINMYMVRVRLVSDAKGPLETKPQRVVVTLALNHTEALRQIFIDDNPNPPDDPDDACDDPRGRPSTYFGDIPISVARAAHSGTSFVPEKRADQEITSFANTLSSDYRSLLRYARTPEKLATLREAFGGYRAGYRTRYVAMLLARSRCMSTMITGGSNFPTARNAKHNSSADKRISDAIDYRKHQLDKIRKALTPELAPIMSGDDDAVSRLTAKIAKLEDFQAKAKVVNATIRKHAKAGPDAQAAALVALGYREESARNALVPNVMGYAGIPPYELTNNNANIRRLKERLAATTTAKSEPVAEVAGDRAKLEDSPADNRVRLFFPGKPDAETRGRLKSAGFRWTPSLGCWQAYRNTHSLEVASREAGASILPAVAVP